MEKKKDWPGWAIAWLEPYAEEPEPELEPEPEPGPVPVAEALSTGSVPAPASGPRPPAPSFDELADPKAADAKRRRKVLAGLLVLALIAGGMVGVVNLIGTSSSSQEEAPTAQPAASTTDAPFCDPMQTATTWRGASQGDYASVVGAIAGFQYGYYVERSGEAARQWVAPDADVPEAEEIQAGIDEAVTSGTEYCLTVTPLAGRDGEATATVEQRSADGRVEKWGIEITSEVIDDKVLITGIYAPSDDEEKEDI